MKLHKKQLLVMGMAAGLSVLSVFPALAGEWKQLEGGEFWQKQYVEADGTYPVSTWQQIDGSWYHFDANGYLDIGWKYLDGNWRYFETNGVMLSNLVCNGGRLDENGVWVSDKTPPTTAWDSTPEDDTYWTAKLMGYGFMEDTFQNNGNGSYTMTCAYDQYATLPDLYNAVFAKAAYSFNGFDYTWRMTDGLFTFTVSNVGTY